MNAHTYPNAVQPAGAGVFTRLSDDVSEAVSGISASFRSSNPFTTEGAPHPGRQRPVGALFLLYVVTLGIYGVFWIYLTHEELRTSTRRGLGGLVGLLLWFVAAPVVAFTLPHEIEQAYAARGAASRVRAVTGLWILLPVVGSIVWFVKVQRALNCYWASSSPPRFPAMPATVNQ